MGIILLLLIGGWFLWFVICFVLALLKSISR